jgi:hypothetical protein
LRVLRQRQTFDLDQSIHTTAAHASHAHSCASSYPVGIGFCFPVSCVQSAFMPTGLPEVSYRELFKIGLLGLLISTVSTAALSAIVWWLMK